jgi:hypothetical protein
MELTDESNQYFYFFHLKSFPLRLLHQRGLIYDNKKGGGFEYRFQGFSLKIFRINRFILIRTSSSFIKGLEWPAAVAQTSKQLLFRNKKLWRRFVFYQIKHRFQDNNSVLAEIQVRHWWNPEKVSGLKFGQRKGRKWRLENKKPKIRRISISKRGIIGKNEHDNEHFEQRKRKNGRSPVIGWAKEDLGPKRRVYAKGNAT